MTDDLFGDASLPTATGTADSELSSQFDSLFARQTDATAYLSGGSLSGSSRPLNQSKWDKDQDFARGVSSATSSAIGSFKALRAAVNEWAGDPYEADRLIESATINFQQAAIDAPRITDIADIEDGGDLVDWAQGAMGQLAYIAMAEGASMAGGAATQILRRGVINPILKRVSKDLSKKSIAKSIGLPEELLKDPRVQKQVSRLIAKEAHRKSAKFVPAAKMASVTSFFMGLESGQNAFDIYIEKGQLDGETLGTALKYGMPAGALNLPGYYIARGMVTMPKGLKGRPSSIAGRVGDVLKKAGIGASAEVPQEMTQEALNILAVKDATNDPSPFSKDDYHRLLNAGATALVASSVLTGGIAAGRNLGEYRGEKKAAKRLKKAQGNVETLEGQMEEMLGGNPDLSPKSSDTIFVDEEGQATAPDPKPGIDEQGDATFGVEGYEGAGARTAAKAGMAPMYDTAPTQDEQEPEAPAAPAMPTEGSTVEFEVEEEAGGARDLPPDWKEGDPTTVDVTVSGELKTQTSSDGTVAEYIDYVNKAGARERIYLTINGKPTGQAKNVRVKGAAQANPEIRALPAPEAEVFEMNVEFPLDRKGNTVVRDEEGKTWELKGQTARAYKQLREMTPKFAQKILSTRQAISNAVNIVNNTGIASATDIERIRNIAKNPDAFSKEQVQWAKEKIAQYKKGGMGDIYRQSIRDEAAKIVESVDKKRSVGEEVSLEEAATYQEAKDFIDNDTAMESEVVRTMADDVNPLKARGINEEINPDDEVVDTYVGPTDRGGVNTFEDNVTVSDPEVPTSIIGLNPASGNQRNKIPVTDWNQPYRSTTGDRGLARAKAQLQKLTNPSFKGYNEPAAARFREAYPPENTIFEVRAVDVNGNLMPRATSSRNKKVSGHVVTATPATNVPGLAGSVDSLSPLALSMIEQAIDYGQQYVAKPNKYKNAVKNTLTFVTQGKIFHGKPDGGLYNSAANARRYGLARIKKDLEDRGKPFKESDYRLVETTDENGNPGFHFESTRKVKRSVYLPSLMWAGKAIIQSQHNADFEIGANGKGAMDALSVGLQAFEQYQAMQGIKLDAMSRLAPLLKKDPPKKGEKDTGPAIEINGNEFSFSELVSAATAPPREVLPTIVKHSDERIEDVNEDRQWEQDKAQWAGEHQYDDPSAAYVETIIKQHVLPGLQNMLGWAGETWSGAKGKDLPEVWNKSQEFTRAIINTSVKAAFDPMVSVLFGRPSPGLLSDPQVSRDRLNERDLQTTKANENWQAKVHDHLQKRVPEIVRDHMLVWADESDTNKIIKLKDADVLEYFLNLPENDSGQIVGFITEALEELSGDIESNIVNNEKKTKGKKLIAPAGIIPTLVDHKTKGDPVYKYPKSLNHSIAKIEGITAGVRAYAADLADQKILPQEIAFQSLISKDQLAAETNQQIDPNEREAGDSLIYGRETFGADNALPGREDFGETSSLQMRDLAQERAREPTERQTNDTFKLQKAINSVRDADEKRKENKEPLSPIERDATVEYVGPNPDNNQEPFTPTTARGRRDQLLDPRPRVARTGSTIAHTPGSTYDVEGNQTSGRRGAGPSIELPAVPRRGASALPPAMEQRRAVPEVEQAPAPTYGVDQAAEDRWAYEVEGRPEVGHAPADVPFKYDPQYVRTTSANGKVTSYGSEEFTRSKITAQLHDLAVWAQEAFNFNSQSNFDDQLLFVDEAGLDSLMAQNPAHAEQLGKLKKPFKATTPFRTMYGAGTPLVVMINRDFRYLGNDGKTYRYTEIKSPALFADIVTAFGHELGHAVFLNWRDSMPAALTQRIAREYKEAVPADKQAKYTQDEWIADQFGLYLKSVAENDGKTAHAPPHWKKLFASIKKLYDQMGRLLKAVLGRTGGVSKPYHDFLQEIADEAGIKARARQWYRQQVASGVKPEDAILVAKTHMEKAFVKAGLKNPKVAFRDASRQQRVPTEESAKEQVEVTARQAKVDPTQPNDAGKIIEDAQKASFFGREEQNDARREAESWVDELFRERPGAVNTINRWGQRAEAALESVRKRTAALPGGEAVVSLIRQRPGDKATGRGTTEAAERHYYNKWYGRVKPLRKRKGESRRQHAERVRALRDEIASGNVETADAKEVAAGLRDFARWMGTKQQAARDSSLRKDARAGKTTRAPEDDKTILRILEGWNMPHNYAIEQLITQPGKERFFELLDKYEKPEFFRENKTASEADWTAFREYIVKKIVNSEGLLANDYADNLRFNNSRARVLRNIPTWELLGRNGEPTLIDNQFDHAIRNYLHDGARQVAWEERFGGYEQNDTTGQWQWNANRVIKDWHESLKTYDRANGTDMSSEARDLIDILQGRSNRRLSAKGRMMTNVATAVMNMLVLPMAVFASFPDLAGVAMRADGQYRDLLRNISSSARAAWGSDPEGLKEMAESLGIASEHVIQHAFLDEGNAAFDNYSGGKYQKVMQTQEGFFKLIQLEAWTNFTRILAMQVGRNFLDNAVADLALEKSHPGVYTEQATAAKEAFTELGLTPEEWTAISQLRNSKAPASEFSGYMEELEAQVMNKFVDEAIMRPSAAIKPGWHSDPRWATVAHLKSYFWYMSETYWPRIFKQFGLQKTDEGWEMNVNGPAAARILGAGMMMLPLAMLGLAMRDMTYYAFSNSEPPDRDIADLIGRTGALGPWTLPMEFFDTVGDRGLSGNTIFRNVGPIYGYAWGALTQHPATTLSKSVPGISWFRAGRDAIKQGAPTFDETLGRS